MTKDNKTGSFRGVFGCVANIDRKSGYKRQARLNRLNYSRYEAMPKNKPILGLTEGAGKGDIEQSIGENGAQGMTVGSVYRGKVAKCPAIPNRSSPAILAKALGCSAASQNAGGTKPADKYKTSRRYRPHYHSGNARNLLIRNQMMDNSPSAEAGIGQTKTPLHPPTRHRLECTVST